MLPLNDVDGIHGPTNHLHEYVARDVAKLDEDQRTEILLLPHEWKMPHVDARFGIVVEIADVILVGGVETLTTNLQIGSIRGVLQDRDELIDPVQLDDDARLPRLEPVRRVASRVRLNALLDETWH